MEAPIVQDFETLQSEANMSVPPNEHIKIDIKPRIFTTETKSIDVNGSNLFEESRSLPAPPTEDAPPKERNFTRSLIKPNNILGQMTEPSSTDRVRISNTNTPLSQLDPLRPQPLELPINITQSPSFKINGKPWIRILLPDEGDSVRKLDEPRSIESTKSSIPQSIINTTEIIENLNSSHSNQTLPKLDKLPKVSRTERPSLTIFVNALNHTERRNIASEHGEHGEHGEHLGSKKPFLSFDYEPKKCNCTEDAGEKKAVRNSSSTERLDQMFDHLAEEIRSISKLYATYAKTNSSVKLENKIFDISGHQVAFPWLKV